MSSSHCRCTGRNVKACRDCSCGFAKRQEGLRQRALRPTEEPQGSEADGQCNKRLPFVHQGVWWGKAFLVLRIRLSAALILSKHSRRGRVSTQDLVHPRLERCVPQTLNSKTLQILDESYGLDVSEAARPERLDPWYVNQVCHCSPSNRTKTHAYYAIPPSMSRLSVHCISASTHARPTPNLARLP